MHLVTALGVLIVTLGCKGPSVPHPITSESRYTCCNIHYERAEITDVNFQKGALIPFGTRVQILEVRGNRVKFEAAGHPPITLVLRYGKGVVSMDQYLDRMFVRDDPRATLRPAAATKGKKGAEAAPSRLKSIEQGAVEPGMTRAEVLMALGYPPPHRTPSLEGPMWTYWDNRWTTFEVYFDGDRVSRVGR